jgi:hypothetical protein
MPSTLLGSRRFSRCTAAACLGASGRGLVLAAAPLLVLSWIAAKSSQLCGAAAASAAVGVVAATEPCGNQADSRVDSRGHPHNCSPTTNRGFLETFRPANEGRSGLATAMCCRKAQTGWSRNDIVAAPQWQSTQLLGIDWGELTDGTGCTIHPRGPGYCLCVSAVWPGFLLVCVGRLHNQQHPKQGHYPKHMQHACLLHGGDFGGAPGVSSRQGCWQHFVTHAYGSVLALVHACICMTASSRARVGGVGGP